MAPELTFSRCAGLVNGGVRVLLRDQLAMAGEERLRRWEEAESGAGIFDVRAQAAACDGDRGVLPPLEDAVGDGGLHAQAELGMGPRATREVPAEAVPAAVVTRDVHRQLQVGELDSERRRRGPHSRAVVRVVVDLAEDRVKDFLELLLGHLAL